jgi:Type II secretion system (T2SS), protein G
MPASLLLALLLSSQAATISVGQTQPGQALTGAAESNPDEHARLHPAEASYYVRIPDLHALPGAYLKSPLMLLALDPELEAVVDSLSGGQVRISDLLDQARDQMSVDQLPPEMLEMGLDRALATARGLSISLTWPAEIDAALGETRALLVTVGRMEQLQTAIFEAEFSFDAYFDDPESQDEPDPAEETAEAAESEGLTDLSTLDVAPHVLLDGWGRPFLYERVPTSEEGVDSDQRHIISLGADGAQGGEGLNADLIKDINSAEQSQQLVGAALLKNIGLEVAFSFDDAQVASDLAKAMGAKLPPGVKAGQHSANGVTWSTYAMTQESPLGDFGAWMAHAGKDLVLGFAKNDLQEFIGRSEGRGALGSDSGFIQARAGTEQPAGQVVVESYQTQSLLSLSEQLLGLLIDLNGQPEVSGLPISLDGPQLMLATENAMRLLGDGFGPRFGRTVLGEGVFHKRRFQPSSGSASPRLIGSTSLDLGLLEQVDPEAGIIWAGGADIRGLFDVLCQQMGFTPEIRGEFPKALLQEQSGFSFETDLLGQLEPQAAFAAGIVKGLAPPALVGYFKAKDAAKLQRGLEAWLRGLVRHDPEVFSLKDRPYKKLPFYELKVLAEPAGAGEEAPASTEFVFGLRGDLLYVSTNSKAVKDELRREINAESPRSALVGNQALEGGATEVLFIDYPAFIGGIYGLVKGFGALAASAAGEELPFDLTQLPDVDLLVRHFQPTLAVTRSSSAGVAMSSSSSFGPEIPMGGLMAALMWTAVAVESSEIYIEPQDAAFEDVDGALAAAPVDALEGTRSKLLRLRTALEVYHWDRSAYPNALLQLTEPSASYPQGYLDGAELPLDDWGHPFVYAITSEGGFLLRSMGPNGQDDRGEGDDVRAN